MEPEPLPPPEPVITLQEPEPQPEPPPQDFVLPETPLALIKRLVCEHYNITLVDLLSERRTRTIARPRQVAMYLAKKLTKSSLPAIGKRMGHRDHTTVLHGVRKIEELLLTDYDIKTAVDELSAKLAVQLEPVT
jgi:chromosomal replication initiation ATPase DnaA